MLVKIIHTGKIGIFCSFNLHLCVKYKQRGSDLQNVMVEENYSKSGLERLQNLLYYNAQHFFLN